MSQSSTSNKKELEQMLQAACHFGHRAERWNPKMSPYIYSKREGIHVFDLTKTQEMLQKAVEAIHTAAEEGKTILLVCTKLQATRMLAESAEKSESPYVTRKWMPGLLTNFDTIKKRIKYFRELKDQKTTGEWDKYTKKERLELSRTLEKLEGAFSGVEQLQKLPDMIIALDAVRDILVLKEAKTLKIPTIAVCDSNSDPDLVTYPVPGNDDAVRSLRYFLDRFADAIITGKRKHMAVQVAPPEKLPEQPVA